MQRRYGIAITIAYALAYGAAFAAANFYGGITAVPIVALWAAAPVIGFLVGRWWVIFAVVGVLAGHAIGWDSAENDGNPALWPPYVIVYSALIGGPLALGALASFLWRSRRGISASGPARPAR